MNLEIYRHQMLEGRRAKIIMPWGNASLDVLIEHKSLTRDLVDNVASKCKLLERSYFGLAFRDSMTNQLNWLQLDKRVLDYDLPRSRGFVVLHFAVRFFVDTYARLQTTTALELLYLQSKEHVFKGDLECSDEDAFKLAALVLQETCGDYTDDESTKKVISKYPLLPSFVLQKHPSISYCEKKILDYYKSLTRNTRGLVIVGFLSIVESLPSFGTHYYLVKDKDGLPWWLGMNRRGIAVYDYNDRSRPRKWFKWGSIENIFYRDKKFCLEVFNSRRVSNKADVSNLYEDAMRDAPDDLSAAIAEPTTQVSISKRVYGPSTVDVHHWVCASSQFTESVWSMAVSQHKFSVEMSLRSPNLLRSNDEIVRDLNSSTPLFSEPGWTDHSQPATDLALETKKILSSAGSDVLEKAKQQLKVLKEKKLVLNDNLTSKLRELKRLCLEEANLIGELPKEYPLEVGESVPKVKKRVGTSYSLCPNIINNSARDSSEISKEVLEYELQDKITKAALVLAQEEKIPKNIRKSRIESYHKEWKKLKAMESNLKQMTKHRRSKDESIKKLRSMAEPTGVLPLGEVEPKNRRSLETLHSISQHSRNSEEHSRGRLKSARQDHFNPIKHPSTLKHTSSSSSCRHKSAPSSPTLPRHLEHNHQQYQFNFPKQRGGFACHDHERCSTSKSVANEYGLPLEHQRHMADSHNLSQHSINSFINNVNHFGYFPLNVIGPYHSGAACPSASFVIPLSADPRITSRNFAAGYGLLTCETPIPRVQPKRWGSGNYDSSSQESGYGGRYQSQMLASRGTDQMLNHFSRMHVGENLCRYKSDSSSTLSSSSGGASGSTSSCNKLFTKSSAYPTPSQIGSLQQVPSDFINTSDSSITSFNNFEQQVAPETRSYFPYKRWNENMLARTGSDYLDRAPSSRDSGYTASSHGVSSTPPVQCFGSSHPCLINPLPSQTHTAYKREMSKPFETTDISKYSEAQRVTTQSLDFQRFHGHPNHMSSGSFSSTSSAGSLSQGSASSFSMYRSNNRSPHYSCNSNTYNNCHQVPQADGRKDVTLTRENVDDYYQELDDEPASRTALLSSSISRSRKPILYGSDVSVELLMHSTSNNKAQGIDGRQRMSDSTDAGSAKESSFNSFPFEAKVAQEFEAEMLEWYEMCGISPQPDDKFTLV